jgi:shikimate dehydrogenase
MKRLGVLGWPVAHSRSPAIHRAALAALGLDGYSYQLLPVPPELFDETVRALGAAGFVGANVTIPHKEAALALADNATERARAIGAANTLTFADGAITADNTDAPGLIASLDESPRGKSAVVLGAGGSARAAAWALKDAGAADVLIHNRTPERAQRLAAELGVTFAPELPRAADLLVNCTSVGLSDADASLKATPIPADWISSFDCVVDLVYRSDDTPLIAAARELGKSVVDGLEILVQQGALSFEIWTQEAPPLQPMRDAARARSDGPDEPPRSPTPPPGPSGHGPGG